jgi:O-antigen/teichoic acid export membrane protein
LIAAHLYTPYEVGLAATLISSMSFIAYLSLLGFNSTFIRFLPKSLSRDEQIDTGLALVALAAVVVGGLFVLGAPHFAPKLGLLHHPLYGLGFIVLCIGASINLVTDSIFIAYRSAGYNLLIDGFIGSSSQLVLVAGLIGLGAYGIYAAQGSASAVAMIMSIFFLIRRFNYQPAFKIRRNIIAKVRRYSLGNYAGNIFSILPTILVPIIILNKLGSASAGYFYLAFMMANMLFTIAYAVAQSLFAEGSYEEQQLWPLVKRATILLAALIIPASIGLAVAGPYILNIFGRTYGQHSHQVIIILAAAGPFTAACAVGTVALRITKRIKSIVMINLSYAFIICGLALVWASKGLAWVGAAWLIGQALCAFLIFGLLIWHHRRQSPNLNSHSLA